MWTDFRLKFLRFFRKNKMLIFVILCVTAIILIVNLILKNYKKLETPKTTYQPHVSVMDSDKVPEKIANEVEQKLAEYMEYCNDADWASAYNMLSKECKEIEFDNNIEKYMAYVYTKMPTPKNYTIQNYSNDGDTYIYQVKYTDDILATGLTNTAYSYTEEKIVFKKTRNGIEMSVGNFVDYNTIENVFENEYIKIDVESVLQYYSVERYKVKFTNRSNYTVVLMDGQESNEIMIELSSGNWRGLVDTSKDIVLGPQESVEGYLTFTKFYDNDDDTREILFNSIRVMENYSGTDEVPTEIIQAEIQNAIAKFSVNLKVK